MEALCRGESPPMHIKKPNKTRGKPQCNGAPGHANRLYREEKPEDHTDQVHDSPLRDINLIKCLNMY